MRIAYLTSEYPGISHTFIQREILALREMGIHVETFSIRKPSPKNPQSEADHAEFTKTVYILPARPLRLLCDHCVVAGTRLLRYVRALFYALAVRPPGLRALVWHCFYFVEAVCLWCESRRRGLRHVHVHFAMACATVAMIASRLGDLTFSMTVHGPTLFYNPAAYLLREKVRQAVMVSCISDYCRSQVMAFARPEDWHKLTIVHCGVHPQQYVPRKQPPREASTKLRLLNIGRLSPVKAHAILLQAVAKLGAEQTDVVCTIVGDGPERRRLESLSAELGLQEHVRFAGSVHQDEIQRFYDEADIFVLPSLAEGVPVVLMEAMAKELPVITTRIMGIPELVEHGESGLLIPPGRVGPLAEAILQLAEDPDLRRRMGANGRKKVCRTFDVGIAAKNLRDLFFAMDFGALACPAPGSHDGTGEVMRK